jgi:hypothetical protein
MKTLRSTATGYKTGMALFSHRNFLDVASDYACVNFGTQALPSSLSLSLVTKKDFQVNLFRRVVIGIIDWFSRLSVCLIGNLIVWNLFIGACNLPISC